MHLRAKYFFVDANVAKGQTLSIWPKALVQQRT
jgi:hypothetical protein